jgi:ParB family chromosome partitioning protein
MLQPVLVRPAGDGEYQLVAGERRWRAAQLAGLERIPAIIRAASDAESVELALTENLQREDLNALERAEAYRQYLDAFGASVDELAVRVGESRPSVSNYLRLLKLDAPVQDLIRAGELGMGQARAIAGVEDRQAQLALARLAVRRNLSVRQVEALAKLADGVREEGGARGTVERPRHFDDVERAFGRALGLAVQVKPGRGKNAGRIVIRYRSLQEFDRVAERLGAREFLE